MIIILNLQEALHFNGTWRTYQKRVLDQSQNYLEDKKIHIVAAPGSGKTTLGIELIRRAGKPCLVLSPSIVIRQQWLARVEEAFLSPGILSADTRDELLSSDIRKPALITAITYQALHSAMTRQKNSAAEASSDEDMTQVTEETEADSADYTDFDILKAIKEMGIGTVCLDECHHLKNEWWKALEDFIQLLPDVNIISLTATPPYDSTPAQWERYINLCGAIDEEIIVPELVREGSLCPHQDYVYFNFPTADEEKSVRKFRQDAMDAMKLLMADETFAKTVATHAGLNQVAEYEEKFLDIPSYLSSLLIFLNEKKIPFTPKLTKLLGVKQLPKMSVIWMEALLQGFLYDDADSYMCDNGYREDIIKMLKSHNLIIRNKVCFCTNEALEKMLINSKGKINSISKIVASEFSSQGKELRLLILTDYIRKEYLRAIGNPAADVTSLGVLPFFETLRRQEIDGLKLGILCGSLIVIPCEAEERLFALAKDYPELEDKITVKNLSAPDGTPLPYQEVSISGKKHISTSLITKLFEEGYMQVLIGTKALLGEGWDSPCINSLILASFVGSFVLSNQMRGRAIRVMKNNPDKTSNIWHLVCITNYSSPEKEDAEQLSEDFLTLKRRMTGFLGISYTDDTIENGMERLSIIKPPYTKKRVEKINQTMCRMADNRASLKKRWNNALVVLDKMEVADECAAPSEKLATGALFVNLWALEIVSTIFSIFFARTYFVFSKTTGRTSLPALLVLLFLIAGMVFCYKYGIRILHLLTPFRRMESIGKALLQTLMQAGLITTNGVKVHVEEAEGLVFLCCLKGGTTREKDLFAECLTQFFAPVENQRYLMYRKGTANMLLRFFCVPDVLAKSKENAALFRDEMRKCVGNYDLVYTRSAEGRKLLLKARAEAFANINEKCSEQASHQNSLRRKRVKSALY